MFCGTGLGLKYFGIGWIALEYFDVDLGVFFYSKNVSMCTYVLKTSKENIVRNPVSIK